MPHIFVSGAASGLGYAFVQHYAKEPLNKIFAIDHVVPPWLSMSSPNTEATNIKSTNYDKRIRQKPEQTLSNVRFEQVDITDEAAILDLTAKITEECNDEGLQMVIHSAGVRGLVPSVEINCSADVARAETIDTMNPATLERTFQVNAVGSFTLIRALLPLLKRYKDAMGNPAKVLVMGSRMGSVGSNSAQGGGYAYRASKAALNAIVKSFAIDVPEVVFVTVHPGRVETGLVKVKEDGAFGLDEVVPQLLGLLGEVDETWSGRFVDRFGEDIPW